MKILITSAYFYPHVGGGEQALLDVATELVKKGNKVRVVTCSTTGKEYKDIYNGIEIYYYPWKILFGHPFVKKTDLYEHVKWCDVSTASVYTPVPSVSKVARKLKKPFISIVYEVLGKKWYWIESNKIKALIFKVFEYYVISQKNDLYIVDSEATLNDLKKYKKKANVKKIFWISEFDTSKYVKDRKKFNNYFGVTNNDKVFLNYGRPGKTKGLFIYLNAIKKVVADLDKNKLANIKFCFIMANDPMPEKEKFINLVDKYNLKNFIVVRDSVSREDLNNYRMCADYIVVPSITEGFGLSAIEACEFHKSLISSNAGSLPEVTFGEVAEFENRNSNDLAEIIKNVILGKDVFVKKEKKDFSKDTISREFISAFKSVIKKKNKEN